MGGVDPVTESYRRPSSEGIPGTDTVPSRHPEVTPGSAVISKDPAGKALQLRGIFDIVRSNLQRAFQEQARHYNLRRREWRPKLGDKVWIRQHPLSKAAEGFAVKLDFGNAAAEEEDGTALGGDTRG